MTISAQEYQYRTSELASLDFEDATPRLAGFVEWIEADDRAAAALQELRSRDVQPLLDAAGFQNPPKAKTPEDVAAIGLAIIEQAVQQRTEIFQIGFAIGVRSTSSRIQDTSDEIMRRYIRPLIKYLDVRLFLTPDGLFAQATLLPVAQVTVRGELTLDPGADRTTTRTRHLRPSSVR